MISSDAEILKLKNVIKEEVCKLAWADNLTQEAVDEMILRMFPVQSRTGGAAYIRKEKSSGKE